MTIEERFATHRKPSTIKKRGNYKLYNAINKYGVDNFYIELLEDDISADDIDEKEIYYISLYDSYENGYNSTRGGDTKTICLIEDVEKLKELYNSGLTYEEIGKYFNVHKATIMRTLHSIGIYKNKTIPKEFLEENKDRMTNEEIADIFNVHPGTVSRAFKRYNIRRGKGYWNKYLPQNQKKK